MPKRLAILRHAKSDWSEHHHKDFERPLNKRGREAAATMRDAIAERRLTFDAILASPAVRTRQTLHFLGLEDRARWDQHIYLASEETLLGAIREVSDDENSVLLVGHNPGLQELVLYLARADHDKLRRRVLEKFPTAALALLDLDIPSWAELTRGCATITELLLPRELD